MTRKDMDKAYAQFVSKCVADVKEAEGKGFIVEVVNADINRMYEIMDELKLPDDDEMSWVKAAERL